MPLSGLSLVSFPLVPGEEYEVYAVLITIAIAMAILIIFGYYWQK
jgi:hypothetical protein